MTLPYVSLGAGVQSSALLVCAALGLHDCPRADLAIFADTQDEPQWVYDHLATLTRWAAAHGMEVERVTAGRLADDTLGLTGKKRRAAIPVFTQGEDGRAAMLPRQCTDEYKLAPIRRALFRRLDTRRPRPGAVTALIGISFDERDRISDSRRRWIVNRYPLIDAVLRRYDCAQLLQRYHLPIPRKSACVYCPFHNDAYWVELQRVEPASFERACLFDEVIRDSSRRGLRHPVYLHQSLTPLRAVRFDAIRNQGDLFRGECSGMCGI